MVEGGLVQGPGVHPFTAVEAPRDSEPGFHSPEGFPPKKDTQLPGCPRWERDCQGPGLTTTALSVLGCKTGLIYLHSRGTRNRD